MFWLMVWAFCCTEDVCARLQQPRKQGLRLTVQGLRFRVQNGVEDCGIWRRV